MFDIRRLFLFLFLCRPRDEQRCSSTPARYLLDSSPIYSLEYKKFFSSYPTEKLHFVKGDVMVTLADSTNLPSKIAILRLDTDWYESSRYELEQLYNRVVEGGIIIFDDYYHWNGQRKATTGIVYQVEPLGDGKTGSIIKRMATATSL